MRHATIALAALLAILPLSGCVDQLRGDDDEVDPTSFDGVPFAVDVTASDAGDVDSLALTVARAIVHKADGGTADWILLDDSSLDIEVVKDGSPVTTAAAEGGLPVGAYDAIKLELASVAKDGASTTTASEILAAVSLSVAADTTLRTVLVIDPTATTVTEASADVALDEVRVVEDGQVIETIDAATANAAVATGTPPVARINVFAPSGALIYKPDFVAESLQFANSASTALPTDADIPFVGTDSEAVGGASLTAYAWDFDDGSTTTGPSVSHQFTQGGVFEVKLTVTDSRGGHDDQVVRVVVLPPATDTIASFKFEASGDGFTASSGAVTGDDDGVWKWSATSSGKEGAGWAVGAETPAGTAISNPGIGDAVLTSPAISLPAALGIGYSVDYMGAGGSLALQFSMDDGATWDALAGLDTIAEWTAVSDARALSQHAGHAVLLRFVWTSTTPAEPGPPPEVDAGTGWTVDNLKITGVLSASLHKSELLGAGAGDGQSHGHG